MNTALQTTNTSSPQYSAQSLENMRRLRRAKRIRRIIYMLVIYGIAIPGAILFLLPFLWMFSASLKASNEIFLFPPKWIPNPLHWEN